MSPLVDDIVDCLRTFDSKLRAHTSRKTAILFLWPALKLAFVRFQRRFQTVELKKRRTHRVHTVFVVMFRITHFKVKPS